MTAKYIYKEVSGDELEQATRDGWELVLEGGGGSREVFHPMGMMFQRRAYLVRLLASRAKAADSMAALRKELKAAQAAAKGANEKLVGAREARIGDLRRIMRCSAVPGPPGTKAADRLRGIHEEMIYLLEHLEPGSSKKAVG